MQRESHDSATGIYSLHKQSAFSARPNKRSRICDILPLQNRLRFLQHDRKRPLSGEKYMHFGFLFKSALKSNTPKNGPKSAAVLFPRPTQYNTQPGSSSHGRVAETECDMIWVRLEFERRGEGRGKKRNCGAERILKELTVFWCGENRWRSLS